MRANRRRDSAIESLPRDGCRSALIDESRAKWRERLHDLGEYLRRCCDNLPAVQIVAFTGKVADQATSLEHEQPAGRYVPGIEADLEEAIVEAGRDVGEIQRRRAGTAQPSRL